MAKNSLYAIVVLLACCRVVVAGGEEGLVAHWTFNEGDGTALYDRSGLDNHGTLHGPQSVLRGKGYALRFDGVDDYVDCGNSRSLDLRGPLTLSAWVYPQTASAGEPGIVGKWFDSYALTLYRGGCWFYISDGGNNVKTPLETGRWHHVVGTFDGQRLRLYVNGVLAAIGKSKTTSTRPGRSFSMGRILPDPAATSAGRGYFDGMLDEVKVYNRAISHREVVAEYGRQAEQMGCPPPDTSAIGHFRLKPFYYPHRKQLAVRVDCMGVLPIEANSRMHVDLVRKGQSEAAATQTIQASEEQPQAEVVFDLSKLPQGNYEVRAVLERNGQASVQDVLAVSDTAAVTQLPSPEQKAVPPLPPERPEVKYEFVLKPGGGFVVRIGSHAYPVESVYSFPNGGDNRLAAAESPDEQGEPEWRVGTQTADDRHYTVTGEGKFYAVRRKIVLQDNRIEVADTITNKTSDVLGIILGNRIDTRGQSVRSVELPKNYTLFVSAADHGLGMIGLDDVFELQQTTACRDGAAVMETDKFGLDRGASYTIEWAVYPTTTGDYVDFVNTVRKVEKLNRTIEGAFGLVGDEGVTGPPDRRTPIRPEIVQAKGLAYASFFYLKSPADDPGMSLEGVEFARYPKESALLKETIAETQRLNPGLKVMFHVAHGLYLTHEPERLFPDSRVIKEDGRQLHYGPGTPDYYCKYISREKFDQGNRWWIFYPTMENSFGKEMLRATDYMLHEIGASGMYADGFVSGYGQGYTYDCWDGHSVVIDPKTKTVVRKIGNVTYLALPVLKEVVRKVAAAGGIVITNGEPGPRSLWPEHYLTTCETSGGDQYPVTRLYLGPTVMPFGDPVRIHNHQDLYRDVLDKLRWGALYAYYGDKDYAIKEPVLVRHMYPFTREEIHSGWAKGKERIVTRVAGVYGWRGNRQLHRVFRSDARGILVPNDDYSTADAAGVRTQLRLGDDEAAVVERIPVTIEAEKPVNFLVTGDRPEDLRLMVSGKGKVRLADLEGRTIAEQEIDGQATLRLSATVR